VKILTVLCLPTHCVRSNTLLYLCGSSFVVGIDRSCHNKKTVEIIQYIAYSGSITYIDMELK
jgi:hypothetical protein